MQKYTTILDGMLVVNFEENNGGFDYVGYVRNDGAWVIMKSTTATAAVSRYHIGTSDYTTNWTNRTSLTYGLPIVS